MALPSGGLPVRSALPAARGRSRGRGRAGPGAGPGGRFAGRACRFPSRSRCLRMPRCPAGRPGQGHRGAARRQPGISAGEAPTCPDTIRPGRCHPGPAWLESGHGFLHGQPAGSGPGAPAHRRPPVRAEECLERRPAERRRRERLPGVPFLGGVRPVAPGPHRRGQRQHQGPLRLRLRRLPPPPPHGLDRLPVPGRRMAPQGGRARRPRPPPVPRQAQRLNPSWAPKRRLPVVSKDLPRSAAADQQVDPAAVLAFVDAVEADPAIELHSLMVVRHGHVIAEGWWAPHTPERTRLLYSLSKSFTSTALGLALEEGRVGLDDPVVSFFPEFDAEITDPRSRSVTLGHLASMASGHNRDMMQEALTGDPQEPVRGFLLVAPDEEPGTVFAYSQPCTYTLAAIIQRVTGMRLSEYLRPRLFDPLGIGEVGWLTWPPGREQGFSGLFARTEDVAKLGQLYLQGGRWGEDQLLPERYV